MRYPKKKAVSVLIIGNCFFFWPITLYSNELPHIQVNRMIPSIKPNLLPFTQRKREKVRTDLLPVFLIGKRLIRTYWTN